MSINSLSSPVIRGEADLFNIPPTDTTVESSFFAEYKPIVNIQDSDAKIEFRLSGSSTQYIDLYDSFLYLTVKVVTHEGGNLLADAEVSTANNFMHSLFSQVDVYINNQLISSSNNCYAYKSYIENLFSFGKEYIESQGQCLMFYKDSAGGVLGSTNHGYVKRKNRIAGSKAVELIGKLRFDLSSQDRYILNDTNVTISLTKNSDRFSLLYSQPSDPKDSISPKVRFIDASFFVRKQVLYPSIAISHQKLLQSGLSAQYPYSATDIKQFTIATGNQSFIEENVFLGQVPSRVIIGLVSNAAFAGEYKMNPYMFQHFNLNYISVTVNNMPIPIKGMNLDFPKGLYHLPYYLLLNSLGLTKENSGIILTPEEYANGNVFFSYDLNQVASNESALILENSGSVRIELKFANSLSEAVTCLVYSESQAILEIDKFRKASLS